LIGVGIGHGEEGELDLRYSYEPQQYSIGY